MRLSLAVFRKLAIRWDPLENCIKKEANLKSKRSPKIWYPAWKWMFFGALEKSQHGGSKWALFVHGGPNKIVVPSRSTMCGTFWNTKHQRYEGILARSQAYKVLPQKLAIEGTVAWDFCSSWPVRRRCNCFCNFVLGARTRPLTPGGVEYASISHIKGNLAHRSYLQPAHLQLAVGGWWLAVGRLAVDGWWLVVGLPQHTYPPLILINFWRIWMPWEGVRMHPESETQNAIWCIHTASHDIQMHQKIMQHVVK